MKLFKISVIGWSGLLKWKGSSKLSVITLCPLAKKTMFQLDHCWETKWPSRDTKKKEQSGAWSSSQCEISKKDLLYAILPGITNGCFHDSSRLPFFKGYQENYNYHNLRDMNIFSDIALWCSMRIISISQTEIARTNKAWWSCHWSYEVYNSIHLISLWYSWHSLHNN